MLSVLNNLNENNQKQCEEKERNLRFQAIQEILTTEVTYLRQLEILMEVLFTYLQIFGNVYKYCNINIKRKRI